MNARWLILILLLGAVGCAPASGTWRLYQDGTELGAHKATGQNVPAVVVQQDSNGNQHAVQNVAFPGIAIPVSPYWHAAYSHGHPSSGGLQPPERFVWVVGGITEVFVED